MLSGSLGFCTVELLDTDLPRCLRLGTLLAPYSWVLVQDLKPSWSDKSATGLGLSLWPSGWGEKACGLVLASLSQSSPGSGQGFKLEPKVWVWDKVWLSLCPHDLETRGQNLVVSMRVPSHQVPSSAQPQRSSLGARMPGRHHIFGVVLLWPPMLSLNRLKLLGLQSKAG